jgi:hypothetical protein
MLDGSPVFGCVMAVAGGAAATLLAAVLVVRRDAPLRVLAAAVALLMAAVAGHGAAPVLARWHPAAGIDPEATWRLLSAASLVVAVVTAASLPRLLGLRTPRQFEAELAGRRDVERELLRHQMRLEAELDEVRSRVWGPEVLLQEDSTRHKEVIAAVERIEAGTVRAAAALEACQAGRGTR